MQDNTVRLDTGETPAAIRFSDVFNVAVPFIDRHLDEGRGDKVAIRVHGGGQVTYSTLAEHVNRAGNALLDLNISKGDRVLMIVKDGPEFYYLFWGAIKAGIIPVPLNTLLKAKDYSYMIENSEASGVLFSPEYASEVEPALEISSHKPKVTLLTEGSGETITKHMVKASSSLIASPSLVWYSSLK